MLVATLRNLGQYPCPRCLVARKDIRNLGKKRDRKKRTTGKRVDDQARRDKIKEARKDIFCRGEGVDSVKIKRALAYGSLVPVNVSFFLFHCSSISTQ
jgi:hypothetical protein